MVKALDRELKRGTLEMILLKLLSRRRMYGYELINTLEKQGGQTFQLKEGTLYPVLYRLEKAGLIDPEWETQDRGVPRKYYHLTPAGERQLENLIQEWQEFSSAVNGILTWEAESDD
jgi:PadR family transcriptional regulator PadR